jgi:hypothetical protein
MLVEPKKKHDLSGGGRLWPLLYGGRSAQAIKELEANKFENNINKTPLLRGSRHRHGMMADVVLVLVNK